MIYLIKWQIERKWAQVFRRRPATHGAQRLLYIILYMCCKVEHERSNEIEARIGATGASALSAQMDRLIERDVWCAALFGASFD